MYNGVCTRVSDLSTKVDWKLKAVETLTLGDRLNVDTGVFRDTKNDKDTIRLPIKIYDYKADGMLFEPALYSNGGIRIYGYHGNARVPYTTKFGRDFTYGNFVHPHTSAEAYNPAPLSTKLNISWCTNGNTNGYGTADHKQLGSETLPASKRKFWGMVW